MTTRLSDKIGHCFPEFAVTMEPGRVALFCKAIGEDHAPAPGEPVPPTMLGLGMDPDPFDFLDLFGVPIARLLHGEQEITHHRACLVGDRLVGQKTVLDAFEKKGGALLFIVLRIVYRDEAGSPVCESRQTLVVPQEMPS